VALASSNEIGNGQSFAKDHLFVSYAQEDRALAEWLTRKLTADGYRVWCDRFSLLAGESYPIEIDKAIKEQTFRVLAILSQASIHKPNPTKERTLALNLGQQRKEKFLIPLNVNLNATQLDWMTSDLNYVSFSDWAAGYAVLLENLQKIDAPRPLGNQGANAAIETFAIHSPIRQQPETLYTNCIPFTRVPQILRGFSTNRSVSFEEFKASGAFRKAYRINSRTYVTFENSLTGIARDVFSTSAGQWLWNENPDIFGVPAVNIVSSLLTKSFFAACARKSLQETPDRKSFFFPSGLLKDNKIQFASYDGKTWLLVVGQRIFRKLQGQPEICIHHLSFRARVRRNLFADFVLQLRVGLYLTDLSGAPFKIRTSNSRRKKITKNWWNDKWLNRHFAICHFLDDGGNVIVMGDTEQSKILISTNLIQSQADVSIDEENLRTETDSFGEIEDTEILESEDDTDTEHVVERA
jgi:hypothetical protein